MRGVLEDLSARHAPRAVAMVRPHHFMPNPQTRLDNAYQSIPSGSRDEVAQAAYDEVTAMAQALRDAGVERAQGYLFSPPVDGEALLQGFAAQDG